MKCIQMTANYISRKHVTQKSQVAAKLNWWAHKWMEDEYNAAEFSSWMNEKRCAVKRFTLIFVSDKKLASERTLNK